MVHSRAVTQCGKTVIILASRNRDGRWQLRVQGRCRQYFTDWLLPFNSATQATEAALQAIDREGIDAFYENREPD